MSRILYVLDYLSHNTDAEKGATLKEIQAYLLNQTNLGAVSVLSIKRDIERLDTMGYTVGVRKGAHNTAYYYMKERGFTFNEIRFLVDSVSINKFLNNEQKQRLLKKFEGLCSEAEVRKLVGRITLICWTIWSVCTRSLPKSGRSISSTASIIPIGSSNTIPKSET